MRRWLTRGWRLAFAVALGSVAACTLATDLDSLESGLCAEGEVLCDRGDGALTCRSAAAFEVCDGICREPDPNTPCDGQCPPDRELCSGVCREPDPTTPCGGSCPEGLVACGGVCESRDERKSCDGGETCIITTNPGTGCGADGCDPCDLPNADSFCVGEPRPECAIFACQGDWKNCDGLTDNGCEVDVATDPNNCGECGSACLDRPNVAEWACSRKQCRIFRCIGDFADCDGDVSDGCEVDRETDPNHCGSCNNRCESGQTCVGGQCV